MMLKEIYFERHVSNHIVGNLNEDKNMEKNFVTELVQTIKKLKTHMSGFVDDRKNFVLLPKKITSKLTRTI